MKIGRNDTCTCGSGIKYKKCCLLKDEFYEFNVTYLHGKGKKYKCKICLSGEQDLFDLHNKIQAACEWDYDHMFSFFMNNKIWDSTCEFSGNPNGEGSATRTLNKLGLEIGKKFLYVFDYGDEHCFQIEVLSVTRRMIDEVNLGIIETHGPLPEQYQY